MDPLTRGICQERIHTFLIFKGLESPILTKDEFQNKIFLCMKHETEPALERSQFLVSFDFWGIKKQQVKIMFRKPLEKGSFCKSPQS